MCFGGGAKTVQPPKPTPPTQFDYNAGERAPVGNQQQAVATAAAPAAQSASFGSELAGAPAPVSAGGQ